MSENKFDVIIPCGTNDVSFVPKVVLYIRKYILGVEYIYIITNNRFFSKIQNEVKDVNVILLDENTLVSDLNFKVVKALMDSKGRYEGYGWIFQQFLKLGFATTKYAGEYYLSWDADTLPLQGINFFDGEHPIFTTKTEYHKLYFETNERLVNIGKVQPYSFIAEHMVFKTDYVKELLDVIMHSKAEGATWIDKCVNVCDFTMTEVFSEFELYGSYVSVNHPDFYKTRQLRSFRNGGLIRGRHINDKLLGQLAFDLDIASFEYKSEAPFPYNLDGWFWRKFRGFAKWKNMPLREFPIQLLNALQKRL